MPVRPSRRKPAAAPRRKTPRIPEQGALFADDPGDGAAVDPGNRATASSPAPKPSTPPTAATRSEPSDGPALRAWVDGGARGNPGPAGYGAHIEDEEGRVVRDLSGFLGVTTNNVAEYRGLLAALETALELRARALLVLADSELVVKQMNGQYKVKHERLRPLFLEAQRLAARLPKFAIRHVRREQNRDADRLANEAMDRGN